MVVPRWWSWPTFQKSNFALQASARLFRVCHNMFDSSWRHTLFTMVPKSGDLQQTKNWRPIAIFKITYKICAKMRHDRSQPLLETEQSTDQVGFRRGTGTDHALAVFETVCGKSIEWNFIIWIARLDLTKAFVRVEHNQLFQALRGQHVPQPYIASVTAIYFFQSGAVHGGKPSYIKVESNRVTSSAQCFSMLLWSVLCGTGREYVSIVG